MKMSSGQLPVVTFGNVPSSQQWHALLDIIEQDDELRTGQFLGPNGKVRVEKKWEEVARKLNAIPGCMKTGRLWKDAHTNLKGRARKAYNDRMAYMKGTGGGPAPDGLGLNELYTRVLKTINIATACGNLAVPSPLEIRTAHTSRFSDGHLQYRRNDGSTSRTAPEYSSTVTSRSAPDRSVLDHFPTPQAEPPRYSPYRRECSSSMPSRSAPDQILTPPGGPSRFSPYRTSGLRVSALGAPDNPRTPPRTIAEDYLSEFPRTPVGSSDSTSAALLEAINNMHAGLLSAGEAWMAQIRTTAEENTERIIEAIQRTGQVIVVSGQPEEVVQPQPEALN